MNLSDLANSPWTPAVAGFVAAQLGVPAIRWTARRVRAWFGPISGTYLGLTGNIDNRVNQLLVETVRCRHVNDEVAGVISGVAVASTGVRLEELRPNTAGYIFDGRVDGRALQITYRSSRRRVQGSGVLALYGDDSGDAFAGQWAGSLDGEIATAPCVWLRIEKRLTRKENRSELLRTANEWVESIREQTGRAGKAQGMYKPRQEFSLPSEILHQIGRSPYDQDIFEEKITSTIGDVPSKGRGGGKEHP